LCLSLSLSPSPVFLFVYFLYLLSSSYLIDLRIYMPTYDAAISSVGTSHVIATIRMLYISVHYSGLSGLALANAERAEPRELYRVRRLVLCVRRLWAL